MDPLVKALLMDMRNEAEAAMSLTDSLSNDIICDHPVLSRAVAHSLLLIGEAARQMPAEFRSAHPALAWNEARALRNRIVHGYRTVVPEILIETVRQDLPVLVAQIDRLLTEESST